MSLEGEGGKDDGGKGGDGGRLGEGGREGWEGVEGGRDVRKGEMREGGEGGREGGMTVIHILIVTQQINRPFPRSMRSQGKRPGRGSRQTGAVFEA